MSNAMSAMSREEREEMRLTLRKGETVLMDIPVPDRNDIAVVSAFVFECEAMGPQTPSRADIEAARRLQKTI